MPKKTNQNNINNKNNKKDINKLNKKRYFAYTTTGMGFINCFDTIFNSQKLEKIYIIKGGEDSCFLSKIAEKAENKKYSTEYFLSPFDLTRLNGIIIKEIKTAVVHEDINACPTLLKYPALIENIINLYDFYDEEKLIKHKSEIFDLVTKKEEYINLSYKFLKAANEIAENTEELTKRFIDHEKLDMAIERIVNKYVNEKYLKHSPKTSNIISDYKFINAVSTAGNIELDTFEAEAKKIFYISNEHFSGWQYTKKIAGRLPSLCKVICPDALNPTKIKAVYLKDLKILFVIKNKIPDKIYDEKYNFINMERFIDPKFKKEHKQKLRFIQKCFKSITDETIKYLKESEAINSNIENIYKSSVKTEEKNKYTESFIKKIIP